MRKYTNNSISSGDGDVMRRRAWGANAVSTGQCLMYRVRLPIDVTDNVRRTPSGEVPGHFKCRVMDIYIIGFNHRRGFLRGREGRQICYEAAVKPECVPILKGHPCPYLPSSRY